MTCLFGLSNHKKQTKLEVLYFEKFVLRALIQAAMLHNDVNANSGKLTNLQLLTYFSASCRLCSFCPCDSVSPLASSTDFIGNRRPNRPDRHADTRGNYNRR